MIFNEFKRQNHVITATRYDACLEDTKGIVYTQDLFPMDYGLLSIFVFRIYHI